MITVFAVVCSESISSEGNPAARLESIKRPLPPSDCKDKAVVPVAAAASLVILTKFLVPVEVAVEDKSIIEPVVNPSIDTAIPLPVVAASAVILRTSPVRTPAAESSTNVPLVAIEAILATFVVVCSESTSSAYPPAARFESTKIPLPESDVIASAVVPVAPVLSLVILARLLVPVDDESDKILNAEPVVKLAAVILNEFFVV